MIWIGLVRYSDQQEWLNRYLEKLFILPKNIDAKNVKPSTSVLVNFKLVWELMSKLCRFIIKQYISNRWNDAIWAGFMQVSKSQQTLLRATFY